MKKSLFRIAEKIKKCFTAEKNEGQAEMPEDVVELEPETLTNDSGAEIAEFVEEEPVLLILINHSAEEKDYYDATRFAWKLNVSRAEKAKYILSVIQGEIVAAFVADKWFPATVEKFGEQLTTADSSDRYGFYGRPAPKEIQDRYVGKRIPDEYRKRGASNPIKYTYS